MKKQLSDAEPAFHGRSIAAILTREIPVRLVSDEEVRLAIDTPVRIYRVDDRMIAGYSGNFFEVRAGEFMLAS